MIVKKLVLKMLILALIFSCKEKKKNVEAGLSNIGSVYFNVKVIDKKDTNIKGVIEYFNIFEDTLLIENPKDDRYLRAYIHLSKDFVPYKQFPEQLSDTFVAYSRKIRDTLKFNFSINRKKNARGKYNLKIKMLDQVFLNSYDSVKVRYIELPFFYSQEIFLDSIAPAPLVND